MALLEAHTMTRDPEATADSDGFHRPHVNSALVVSAQSVVWNVLASIAAVALGIRSGTAVLVAFGAIGIVDAIGSVALVYHFHHALRHEALSEELERLAHRVVLVGLFLVGCAAVIGGVIRLMMDQSNEPSAAGVALAAASLVALVALSARKQRIARRVSSDALLSDGHLSAIGAMQAAVALAGTAATLWLAWDWSDAAATSIVGCVAVTLAIFTWRAEHQPSRRTHPAMTAPVIALVVLGSIVVTDWLLGPRLILIGLLVAGPAIAALCLRPRPTASVGALAVALAIALGVADDIWLTSEHATWIGAVAVVAITNTAVVAVIGPRIRRLETECPPSGPRVGGVL
jgi:hypothetical protein